MLVKAESWTTYRSFFGVETGLDNTKSKWLRSIFYTGGPLDVDGRRYANLQDEIKEQQNKVADYHRGLDKRISSKEHKGFIPHVASRAYL